MPVDYSKWDKLEDSSDDDSDEPSSLQPRVTRLATPSTVTLTGAGDLVVGDAPSAETLGEATLKETSYGVISKQQQTSDKATRLSTATFPPLSWTDKGAATLISNVRLYWTQDRSTLTIRALLPPNTARRWTCHVSHLVPYKDRYATTMSTSQQLTIQQQTSESNCEVLPFLAHDLLYPVHAAQADDDDDDECDWSIEQHENERYIVVCLNKAQPMDGVTIWWNKLFKKSAEEVNVAAFRGKGNFQEAWDQAHALFRDKLKEKEEAG
jgi:hypothetical protein